MSQEEVDEMPKKVICPRCENEIKVIQNPHICKACQGRFNVVTRSIPIRLGDLDEEQAEKLLKEFAKMVNFSLNEFVKRFRLFRVIEKEKGICVACGQEKNLTMQNTEGKYCSKCTSTVIYGSLARKEIYPKVKEFPIPRKSFADGAFQQAQQLFNKWLKDNWGNFIRRDEAVSQLQQCRERGREKFVRGEPAKVRYIRGLWADVRTAMSPFWFFLVFKDGRRINQKNRKQRRDDLKYAAKQAKKAGLIEKATLPELAYLVAKPVCQACDRAEKYDWGWECELDQILGRSRAKSIRKKNRRKRPGKLPVFQGSIAQIPKGHYLIDVDDEKAKVALYKKGTKEESNILGREWLVREYGEDDFEDNTRYPDLHRPSYKEDKEYYLIYPLTEVIPLQLGEWKHVVAYGPTRTCVLSSLNGQQKVRFFGRGTWQDMKHGGIVSIKEYFHAQRSHANSGYFKRPRLKEGRQIKAILHNETAQISQYLADMPGRVTLLNMQKKQYDRGVLNRKRLNTKLGRWGDSVFRQLACYKLELAGLIVQEKEFELTQLAVCPGCGKEIGGGEIEMIKADADANDVSEQSLETSDETGPEDLFADNENKGNESTAGWPNWGGSWQSMVIGDNCKNIQCSFCGKDINLLLAIAQIALQEIIAG